MESDCRDPDTYAFIGAGMEVHRQLGCGFLESVYQEALAVELRQRNIDFEREVTLPIKYKGKVLTCSYRADFICLGRIIVELKALSNLTGIEKAQVMNYLKAAGLGLGLLLNFGATRLEYERLVLTDNLKKSAPSAKSADKSAS